MLERIFGKKPIIQPANDEPIDDVTPEVDEGENTSLPPLCAAATAIGLTDEELAKVIGASCEEATILRASNDIMDRKAEAFLKFCFVLRTFMNDDKDLMRSWLRNDNMSFGGTPLKVMTQKGGLTLMRKYLEMIVERRDENEIAAIREAHAC